MEHKPSEEYHTKTEAYDDEQRWLRAHLCVKGSHGAAGGNSSAPKAQLRSLRDLLAAVDYMGN